MSTAVATTGKQSLVAKFAAKYSIEPDKLLSILKATAFKVKGAEVTNEQMAALLVVADQYGLNPFTREIFAFPDKQNGIVPVVGVDGWSRIVNDHAQSDGFEFRVAEKIVESKEHQPCPEWMEVVIYRKDRTHPIVVREYIDEVYRKPFTRDDASKVNGPWQTHTKRFLRHKTFIQGARIAYGFSGIYDEDEAERIIEGEATRVPEATGGVSGLKERLGIGKPQAQPENAPPAEETKVVGAVQRTEVVVAIEKLSECDDGETLRLYAEALPEGVRGNEDFTKAFHKRLVELAEIATKDPKAKQAGTPRLRKQFVERFGRADADTLDVAFDETRGYIWSNEDAELLQEAYEERKGTLAPDA